jgi:hypothetical protein
VVTVRNCDLLSTHGFCVWAVQNSEANLDNALVIALRRSGAVLFGQAKLWISQSVIRDCGIHGVCLRGNSALHISRCTITGCKARGVYGYAEVHLSLTDCIISNTQHTVNGAVEYRHFVVSYSRSVRDQEIRRRRKQTPHGLFLKRCSIIDNAGFGVKVVVCVEPVSNNVRVEDCSFNGNIAGDQVYVTTEESTVDSAHQKGIVIVEAPLKREISPSERIGTPQKAESSPKQWCWQFERDDPASGSSRCRWKAYDPTATAALELAYSTWKSKEAFHASLSTEEPSDSPLLSDGLMTTMQDENKTVMDCASKLATATLFVCDGKYRVDFHRLEQTSVKTLYSRKVRRVLSF